MNVWAFIIKQKTNQNHNYSYLGMKVKAEYLNPKNNLATLNSLSLRNTIF